MPNNQSFNPDHYHLLVLNHYLSTDEGKQAVNSITKGLPNIKNMIYTNHIEPHEAIKGQMKLALDDEHPLLSNPPVAPQQPGTNPAVPTPNGQNPTQTA